MKIGIGGYWCIGKTIPLLAVSQLHFKARYRSCYCRIILKIIVHKIGVMRNLLGL
jgi:hypothetical protein